MKIQYAKIFVFLILNQIKRGDSFSLFPISTYVQGTMQKKQLIASLEEQFKGKP